MRPGVAYFDDIIKIAFTLVKTWLVKIWFFFQNIFSALRILAFLVKDSLMARTCTTDDNKTCTKALPQSLKTLFQLILIKPLSRYLPRGEKLSESNAFNLYEVFIVWNCNNTNINNDSVIYSYASATVVHHIYNFNEELTHISITNCFI